jgi:PAS domain S-box-containing protein
MSISVINSGYFAYKSEFEDNKYSSDKFLSSSISSVFDNTEEIVIFFNSQLNLIYANNSFLRLFNYTRNEIYGKNITYFFFSQDVSFYKKDFLSEIKNREDISIFLARKKEGSAIKCHFKSSVLNYGFGNDLIIQFTGGVVQQERSLFNQFLLDTSNLSDILKSFVDYLFVIDNNGYILDFISSIGKKLINEIENPVGRKIQDVLLVDNQIRRKVVRCIFKAVLKNTNQAIEIYDPQSQKVYQLKINPSDENHFIIFIKDITNLKVSIEEKKNLEISLKHIWENSLDGIILLDPNGKVIDANISLCNFFQLKNKKEILGKSFIDLFDLNENTKAEYITGFKNNFELRSFANYKEISLNIHSGNKKTFIVTFSFIEFPEKENQSTHNQPLLLCICKDITESKAQEQVLRQKEELYHNFINNSSEAIILTDLNGNILNVNKRALKLFKYTEANEITKKNIHDFISSDQKRQANIIFQKIVAQRTSIQEEFCLYNKDGMIFNGDINASLLINAENHPYAFMIFIKDMTEQKKMERELENAKFFATIGKMASLISHQIKTPLSAVKMNIDMLQNKLNLNELEKKSFEIISKEINRLTGLTKNILIYSKEAEPKFNKIDLQVVIESIKFLFKPMLDEKGITFNNNLSKVEVNGDMILLQSLFLQLIENSVDAIEKKGLIEIDYKENKDDSYSIFVKDNGCGISEYKKIFEPFYSTKSSGTGLGVPIAERILKQHKGSLNLVSSKKGETIFEIKIDKYSIN